MVSLQINVGFNAISLFINKFWNELNSWFNSSGHNQNISGNFFSLKDDCFRLIIISRNLFYSSRSNNINSIFLA